MVATIGTAVLAQNQPPAQNNANGPDLKEIREEAQKLKAELEEGDINFLELLMKGEWFMIPLALCSLIGVTLIIERALALTGGRVSGEKGAAKVLDINPHTLTSKKHHLCLHFHPRLWPWYPP